MRKILAIVMVIIMCAWNASAQDPGSYTENPELDRFVGEWVYSNNGKSLRLFLTKEKTYVEFLDSYVDALVGFYEYKPDKASSLGNKDKNKIIAGRLVELHGNAVTFLMTDPAKNKAGQATLELMPNDLNQAKFRLNELEGVKLKERQTSTSGFSLPTDVIVKKAQ